MRTFACPACASTVYFENTVCSACGTELAFAPARLGFVGRAASPLPACTNAGAAGCNWLAHGAGGLCLSCRLTETIPPIDDPLQRRRWSGAEAAKRRLVYDLLRLGLAPQPIVAPDHGLTFRILVDAAHGGEGKVIMGHDSGLITIDATEADTHLREERRERLGEAYRTMLGHMRHETGHYIWDRLAALPGFLEAFRPLFGDERADYGEALKRYYAAGAAEGWEDDHISAYATMHPWEDWAETFAHYLHMIDGVETAGEAPACLSLPEVPDAGAPSTQLDATINAWIDISLFLNMMNRGMGHHDFYPFVLGGKVREKLAFIHAWLKTLAETQPADPAAR